MAQLLGNVAVGTIVKLKENGSPVDYIVVQQGKPGDLYDDSCDGTWLLRKDTYGEYTWGAGGTANYSLSDINTYLNNTVFNSFETNIKNVIKQIKIPYLAGSQVLSKENGLLCKIFLLSGREVGFTSDVNSVFMLEDGIKLSYFLSGDDTNARSLRIVQGGMWWTRTGNWANNNYVMSVNGVGSYDSLNYNGTWGVLPSLIFPVNLLVLDDGNISTGEIPTLTVPLLSYVTQPFTVSWTSVESADSYTLQRNIDNSTWETVYTGLNLSYQDTISSGSSVQYRVCATALGQTGDYSNPKTVNLRQTSPTPTLTMPGTVDLFTTYTISWGAVANADGYIVQKQVNDGDWVSAYTGSGTSFQDSTFYLSTKYRIASTISAGDGYQSPWSQEYQLSINMSGTPIQMTINQDGSYNELYPTTLIGNILGMDKYGYSQQQILSDTTKGVLGLEDNAIPDQAFSVLQSAISSGAKIEVGSYVGTGKYGQDDPTKITFGFVPKFVLISTRSNSGHWAIFNTEQLAADYKVSGGYIEILGLRDTSDYFARINGTELEWYSSNDSNASYSGLNQQNLSGVTYYYIAIG